MSTTDGKPEDGIKEPGPPASEPNGATQQEALASGIALTERAAEEVRRIIQEEKLPEDTALRVGAKGGGCSGFTYVLDFDQTGRTEFDVEYESYGVQILIDKKSEFFMSGTVVDFNNGLLNRGFVFTNPKASGSCGCGLSFQV